MPKIQRLFLYKKIIISIGNRFFLHKLTECSKITHRSNFYIGGNNYVNQ